MKTKQNNPIGKNIRYQRELAGLSITTLAHMVGRSRPYLSRIEHGHANPTLKVIEDIASGLGVSPAVLISGAEDEASALR